MELHRLADGRFLCHQSFGDPQGLPLIYCHGWSASRLEASLIELLAVRLIAIDRPGYGGSTPCRGRTLLGWPADVQSLLDVLGLARVGIVGVSGGGPYALACARALPQRIAAVGLISPVPPARGPYLGNCPLEALYRIGRNPLLGQAVLGPARWLLLRQWLGPGLFFGLSSLPPADRAALTAARADCLLASCREGLRQGIAGPLSDARIYAAPWGFALSDVAVRYVSGTARATRSCQPAGSPRGQPPRACRSSGCPGKATSPWPSGITPP